MDENYTYGVPTVSYTMTPRERWLALLAGKPVDRIPTDYQATDEVTARLVVELGCADEDELWPRLHIDARKYVESRWKLPHHPDDPEADMWGVRYQSVDYGTGTYEEPLYHPLGAAQTVADIHAHRWPDPDESDYDVITRTLDEDDRYRPIHSCVYEPFLLYCYMRGLELAYEDLAIRPELADAILGHIFDYYYEHIKAADPTAKISGPSFLNWDFTCIACPGYQSGQDWFTSFIDAYAIAHDGASPPADIWAIDTYPLNWASLPMTDWNIVVNQIQGFRNYLSTQVPGHATTPIFINEVASHWGFSGLELINGEVSIPAGQSFTDDFLWDEMEQYLINLLDWLKANGPSLYIDRWFLYATHVDITQTVKNWYAGIELFDGFHAEANLNQLGRLYRDYATGVR